MYDFSKSNSKYERQNDLPPDGDYEVVVEKAEVRKPQSEGGQQRISLQLRVRDDVEQPFQNRVIFDNIWPDRENPEEWDGRKIYELIHTGQNVRADGTSDDPNVQTKFDDGEELIQYLNGLHYRVNVRHYVRKSTGDDAIWIHYRPSQANGKTLNPKTSASEPKQTAPGATKGGDWSGLDLPDDDEFLFK